VKHPSVTDRWSWARGADEPSAVQVVPPAAQPLRCSISE
jgi:hypothetical protein